MPETAISSGDNTPSQGSPPVSTSGQQGTADQTPLMRASMNDTPFAPGDEGWNNPNGLDGDYDLALPLPGASPAARPQSGNAGTVELTEREQELLMLRAISGEQEPRKSAPVTTTPVTVPPAAEEPVTASEVTTEATEATDETRFDKHPRFQQLMAERNAERLANEALRAQIAAVEAQQQQATEAEQEAEFEAEHEALEAELREALAFREDGEEVIQRLLDNHRAAFDLKKTEQATERLTAEAEAIRQEQLEERQEQTLLSIVSQYPVLTSKVGLKAPDGTDVPVSGADFATIIFKAASALAPGQDVSNTVHVFGEYLKARDEAVGKAYIQEYLGAVRKSGKADVPPALTRGGGSAPTRPAGPKQALDGNYFSEGFKLEIP